MAKTLSASVRVVLSAVHQLLADLSTPKDNPSISVSASLSDGTEADEVDLLYHDEVTVDNEVVTIDLCGDATVTDKFGDQVDFAGGKIILVQNANTAAGEHIDVFGGTNSIQIGPNDGTDQARVYPGGLVLLYAPDPAGAGDVYSINDGTDDILQLDSEDSGATITANAIVAGVSNV